MYKIDEIIDISNKIYDLNEVEFETEQSAKLISDYLSDQGFVIDSHLAGLKAAFSATYGSGKPVIAILGEYDALNGIGHACGHNLLGTGAMGAVLKVQEQLNGQGTIIYFGCPAEESGYGKAIMVDHGVFDDVDLALTWHPHHKDEVWTKPSLAVLQTYFKFKGISSHAALAPELGRSALDAAELMNIGVNFLREHVPSDVRLHYSFVETGGNSPNVVQSSTTLNYYVRAKDLKTLEETQERLINIAKGAALMSDVELELEHGSACREFKANQYLSNRLADIIKQEKANDFNTIEHVSTDVGDVSQVIPTAQVFINCEPYPFQMHSIEWLKNGKSELAYSGIEKAAEVLSTLAMEIFNDPRIIEEL